jgi:hypothetical protein
MAPGQQRDIIGRTMLHVPTGEKILSGRTRAMSRNVTTPKMAVKLLLLVAFLAPSARAEDARPLTIEQPAPDFALPGVDDKTYRLADFAEAKEFVNQSNRVVMKHNLLWSDCR